MTDVAPYSEMKRKMEHIAPFGFAFTLTIFPKWLVFILSIVAIIYGLFISKRVVKGTLRDSELQKGFSLGKAAYGIMVLILLLFFHHRMHVVAGAWALMALGDGSASIFGTLWGRNKLPWNKDKSWMGLLGFSLVGSLACAGMLLYTQYTGDVGSTIDVAFAAFSFDRIVLVALMTTLICAAFETLPLPVDDNISIPALAGILLSIFTG